MSSSSPQSPTMSDSTSSPLLRSSRQSPRRRQPVISVLLNRATGRRGASMVVRETAAQELEERRVDWGYSKPVVALDMLWNAAFVVVAAVMLLVYKEEKPNVPVRVWICGYAVQCLVHVVLVWLEFRKRNASRGGGGGGDLEAGEGSGSGVRRSDSDDEDGDDRILSTKTCESMNTIISFVWWIVGFYWLVSGGEVLLENASHLYWLTFVFLSFDVFFAVFCVVVACLIGVALCCCLPCIIALLYAVAGQEGASEADLSILPKYKFQMMSNGEKQTDGGGKMIPLEAGTEYSGNERVLEAEDADCCICLSSYEDGTELVTLPCNHHFHSTCIEKWLKMNATCPLCKFNILKGNEQE